MVSDGHGSTWPEQEIIEAWLSKHGVDLPHPATLELKDAITQLRIGCRSCLGDMPPDSPRVGLCAYHADEVEAHIPVQPDQQEAPPPPPPREGAQDLHSRLIVVVNDIAAIIKAEERLTDKHWFKWAGTFGELLVHLNPPPTPPAPEGADCDVCGCDVGEHFVPDVTDETTTSAAQREGDMPFNCCGECGDCAYDDYQDWLSRVEATTPPPAPAEAGEEFVISWECGCVLLYGGREGDDPAPLDGLVPCKEHPTPSDAAVREALDGACLDQQYNVPMCKLCRVSLDGNDPTLHDPNCAVVAVLALLPPPGEGATP